ncbi:MAG: LytTR family DNA-binding domain-containing protein [Holophagales bacterium]|nr:LytTR family DNA-binding domain-containing protein [Holophagales bacterium]
MNREENQSPTSMLRVMIVDDEEPARQLLREFLGELEGVELVGEAENGFEAIRRLAETEVDLLFLDIQMPKLDGFEVVELLGDDAPPVVFVTAYDQYALRAFEVHALDYLLKPFEPSRLREAVRRARTDPARLLPPTDLRPRHEQGHIDRILVREGSRIHVVACRDLDFVEAQDDVVILVSGDRRLRKAERMARLEESLDPTQFVRIHRSYILNVERLERIELYAKDSRTAQLKGGTRLPISRAGYARLRELL